MEITGIILAGGKSSRMGTDKALFKVHQKQLLQHTIDFCSSFCKRLLISSNHPEHDKFGIKRIPDVVKNGGPLGGIYSTLKETTTVWNFVLSVDTVFVEKEFVLEMTKEIGNYSAVVPFHAGGKEPLIAFYHRRITATILHQIEKKNYRMTELLELVNTKWFDAQRWIDEYPRIFHNLNRPEDFNDVE